MYGAIVRKQRDKDKRDITQQELADLVGVSRKHLQKIEYGIAALTPDTREKLSQKLEMPILALFPPDIDSFPKLLEERFEFEINSVGSFIEGHNNQELMDEIKSIHKLYKNSFKNEDSNSRSLADRMLHTKITFGSTDIPKRNAVFLQQVAYIGFFELWIPHLEIAYLTKRRNISYSYHEELFSACLEGSFRKIKAALEMHLTASMEDVKTIKNSAFISS
ncbi:MAG: helix-turn-helix domain-containing protein [Brasilonema angustatum HA4187-MV1]|nr:helix-turn-helix domain-containing protein [Brasilonema angustatum HA4187-MV1]